MSLVNAKVIKGRLESMGATGDTAIAVSEPTVQDVGEGNFTELRNGTVDFLYPNIVSDRVFPDNTLVTEEVSLTDGDTVVVQKADLSLVECTATNTRGSKSSFGRTGLLGANLSIVAYPHTVKNVVANGFNKDINAFAADPISGETTYWEFTVSSEATIVGGCTQAWKDTHGNFLGTSAPEGDVFGIYMVAQDSVVNGVWGTDWVTTSMTTSSRVGFRYTPSTGAVDVYVNGIYQGRIITLAPYSSVYPAVGIYGLDHTAKFHFDSTLYKPDGSLELNDRRGLISILTPSVGEPINKAFLVKDKISIDIGSGDVELIDNSGAEKYSIVSEADEICPIPNMVAESSPSGNVTANYWYIATESGRPYNLFNNSTNASYISSYPSYIGIEASVPFKLSSYTLICHSVATAATGWNIKASNTGAFAGEEVTIHTVSGASWPESYAEKTYTVTEPAVAYLFYRITFTAGVAAYAFMRQLILFAKGMEVLRVRRTYNDVVDLVGAQSVITSVEIGSNSGKMDVFTGDLYT